MALILKTPQGPWQTEKRYVGALVLQQFLGFDAVVIETGSADCWLLGSEDRWLCFPEYFFPYHDPSLYLTQAHLQAWAGCISVVDPQVLGLADYPNPDIPVVLGRKDGACGIEALDIFGTLFFYLTRYEECVQKGDDEIQRFGVHQSIVAAFVKRPVVDEYVWLLGCALKKQFPALPQKSQGYRLSISHDVDVPHSWLTRSRVALARSIVRSLIKERSPARAVSVLRSYFDAGHDPVFCFDWIMDAVEAQGLVSTFYFLVGGRHPYDLNYDLTTDPVVSLLRQIAARGHRIGLHGSIESAVDAFLLTSERCRLEAVAGQAISQGRQHYLRFCAPDSWRVMQQAGITDDSTLGYAEQAGFRCGTARSYAVFDVRSAKTLSVREQPLICMEHSLLGENYQSLSVEEAYGYAKGLWEQVRRFGGNFTLLWHNHNLVTQERKDLFIQILKDAS